MTKTQINKAARKMVNQLVWDAPATTFTSLRQQADEAFGTDEGKVLDAAIAIFDAKSDAARAFYNKLVADCQAIDSSLEDGNTASENMQPGIIEGCVMFWPEYLNHTAQVIACHAEALGIDLRARLGYAFY